MDLKFTFDLAGFCGLRQCRGKATCFCGCQGKQKLQSVPDLTCLPCGDSVEVMNMALVLLRSGCSYGSELMSIRSLQMATHKPPSTWDPARDGPWWCDHCRKYVWKSWAEVHLALEAR